MANSIFRIYGIKNYDLADEIAHDVISEIVMSKKIFADPFNVMGYLRHITKSLICRHLRDTIPFDGRDLDSEKLLELHPQLDENIAKFEANDAIDICLDLLNDKEVLMIEKVRSGESTDNLTREFGYKNKDVFMVRKSNIITKFRQLLRNNGVDI